MICNNIIDKIPELIRKEIDTNERIMIIEHMKSCRICRTEYMNQLKMFYMIDKQLVIETVDFDKKQFSDELESKLSNGIKSGSNQYTKFFTYSAAAVLVLIIFSIFFFNKDQQTIKLPNENVIIEKALLNEDWITLQRLLKSNYAIKQFANEKISVSLLIEKLTRLEKQGVRTIDYVDLFNQTNNKQYIFNPSGQTKELNQIKITKLVQSLEQFKPSKNEITLFEIGLFLSESNKGGTKS